MWKRLSLNIKRHPTIEDNVVIYAQAVILGGDTVIGSNSIVGGNTWITESIPPGSVVYHKSEVKLRKNDNTGILRLYNIKRGKNESAEYT